MLTATSTYADGGMGPGQEPTATDVARRLEWVAVLGALSGPVMARAEHGTKVTAVGLADAGMLVAGDGLITRERRLPLMVTHSDCLPIFLWNAQETICGIVHAGWRGVVAGVLPEALRALYAEGVVIADIRMHVGPHIGPCCFEIQDDVADPLRSITTGAVLVHDNRQYGALARAVLVQAMEFGLTEQQIEIDDRCTARTFIDGVPLFASYRRDRTLPRNMVSVIALA